MGAVINHEPQKFDHIRSEIDGLLGKISVLKGEIADKAKDSAAVLQGDTYEAYNKVAMSMEEYLDHDIQACRTLSGHTEDFQDNHMHASEESAEDLNHALAQMPH